MGICTEPAMLDLQINKSSTTLAVFFFFFSFPYFYFDFSPHLRAEKRVVVVG